MFESDFWDDVEPREVIVPEARRTVAYINHHGHAVIRQEDYDGDDAVVLIPLERVGALIERLRAIRAEVRSRAHD